MEPPRASPLRGVSPRGIHRGRGRAVSGGRSLRGIRGRGGGGRGRGRGGGGGGGGGGGAGGAVQEERKEANRPAVLSPVINARGKRGRGGGGGGGGGTSVKEEQTEGNLPVVPSPTTPVLTNIQPITKSPVRPKKGARANRRGQRGGVTRGNPLSGATVRNGKKNDTVTIATRNRRATMENTTVNSPVATNISESPSVSPPSVLPPVPSPSALPPIPSRDNKPAGVPPPESPDIPRDRASSNPSESCNAPEPSHSAQISPAPLIPIPSPDESWKAKVVSPTQGLLPSSVPSSPITSLLEPMPPMATKETSQQPKKTKQRVAKQKKKMPAAQQKRDESKTIAAWMNYPPNPDTAIFEIPLEVAVERGNEDSTPFHLPLVVVRASFHVRLHMKAEGIFRISGSHAKIQYWKKRYDLGHDPNLDKEEDPHVISGLLKLYLRELPEPILTKKLSPNFEAAKKLDDLKVRAMYYKSLIEQLPLVNYAVLNWLLILLMNVISYESINFMGIENISLIFSPTLKCSVVVIQNFLENFDMLFDRIIARD